VGSDIPYPEPDPPNPYLHTPGLSETLAQHYSLVVFSRYCPLQAYQDRPPVKQCKNCWGLDHTIHKCKEPPRCWLCVGDHKEVEHIQEQECGKCKALEQSDVMIMDGSCCTHNLHCINCSTATHILDKNHTADARRCPTWLEKYGTAHSNKWKALKTDNTWKVVSARKPWKPKNANPTATTTQKVLPEQLACQNQFSIFEDLNPTTYIEEDALTQ